MAVSASQVAVGTSATLLVTATGKTQVLVRSDSNTGYIGPSGVTTATGYRLPPLTESVVDLSDGETLYGVGGVAMTMYVLAVN